MLITKVIYTWKTFFPVNAFVSCVLQKNTIQSHLPIYRNSAAAASISTRHTGQQLKIKCI
jgi:hypothetical protein